MKILFWCPYCKSVWGWTIEEGPNYRTREVELICETCIGAWEQDTDQKEVVTNGMAKVQ